MALINWKHCSDQKTYIIIHIATYFRRKSSMQILLFHVRLYECALRVKPVGKGLQSAVKDYQVSTIVALLLVETTRLLLD